MIAAGEENGSLALVLDQLAKLLERRLELGHKLTSALIYPALLLVMAIGSIFVILTVLVPNIEPLFEGRDAELPAVVAALIAIEAAWDDYWAIILSALAAGIAGLFALLRRPESRRAVDRVMLRLPVLGGLLRKSIASRISLTLATLIESGVPLERALAATINVALNETARHALDQAHEQVVTGARLSQALSASPLFDEAALRLIALGEETNRLHQMLHHIAATSEAQVVRQVERGMMLLTPILTLALGLMVGGIIMSVMQAILGINEIAVR
jgi:type II secretory pathway component PulF